LPASATTLTTRAAIAYGTVVILVVVITKDGMRLLVGKPPKPGRCVAAAPKARNGPSTRL